MMSQSFIFPLYVTLGDTLSAWCIKSMAHTSTVGMTLQR